MISANPSVFDLPDHLHAKADPALIATDEAHFAAIDRTLHAAVADLAARLEEARQSPGGIGQAAMDRDLEVHRLTMRLRTLRRYGLDLCLGRMTYADGREPAYVGRLGLTDRDGRRLLLDWRSPAAEPFFGATHADPQGLASRRRYRWTAGRITDYWDELLGAAALDGHAALDDQSAFIASLGTTRSPRMRDVLATIQADQDAVIRAGSRGALVVDGGPGTGKTVVALHRAAYLVYSDPRLGPRQGGVLFVGPHQPYLAYVADVLPSLGEESVQLCSLRNLVAEGEHAGAERDPQTAALKATASMVRAIETAVRFYESPPTTLTTLVTDWAELRLTPEECAEAFGAAGPQVPHNEARDDVWDALLTILVDKHPGELSSAALRRSIAGDADLAATFNRAWPLIDAADLVGDLWSVPAYLRLCAPWLDESAIRSLQRADPQAWTVSDLPLLDAARRRLGDPEASTRRRRNEWAALAERERMDRVVSDLVDAACGEDGDEYGTGLVTMLRGEDFTDALVDRSGLDTPGPDQLAGPFAHIVVDEAQELTDAEWQMLLARCPSRSFTIVGDRAQARRGFPESWEQRLERVGAGQVTRRGLTVNYRTPAEVMQAAEPVIRRVLPDANVPVSVRISGVPVSYRPVEDLDVVVDGWLDSHPEATACVIGAHEFAERPRVRALTPTLAKGLEFDLVVLAEPEDFGDGIAGGVDRYVAMTRAVQELVVLNRSRTPHRAATA